MLSKSVGAKAAAVALAMSVFSAAIPSTVPVVGVSEAAADPYRHHRSHHRYYRPRHHSHSHSHSGAGVAGAIIGLGIGAAIASQAQPRVYYPAPSYRSYRPAPWTAEWYRYCSAKYRSFDPRSGTFQPYHGPRRLCQ
ncbi:BA14K family protein [Consotaella aegiceratis]|uniref:BA14K family protein n=1 Tax=Consotaella aegiceratis TaxID=3097961 RepID=UPI002F42216D